MSKQISPVTATQLCDNYDTKYVELCKLIKKDDNRSCLFSLTELKNYIDYLEKSSSNIDGIRIYLGSYKNNKGPQKAISNDLTTMFLAPTSNGIDNTKLNAFNFVDPRIPPKKYSK